MYIHFITFGCKVNTCDTACMTRAFEKAGFIPTAKKEEADIFVVNSCTVTSESDKKLGQTLRRLRRNYPLAVIVLTGCYPQAFPEKAYSLDCSDVITGTKNRNAVPGLVKEYLDKKRRIEAVCAYGSREEFEEMSAGMTESHTRAFMKVQEGCCCTCSYCIIPFSRGNIRSKAPEDIRAQAQLLGDSGCKEIVLVGINLGFYGAENGLSIADAVEAASGVRGIERIRLGSLEPERISYKCLERLRAVPELCPSFHLSLQSGCDRILAAMNRRYTAAEYRETVGRVRDMFPGCGITTDVITGFPGETEEDHLRSLEFVRQTGFSDIHVFPYSVREGTKAALMGNRVPDHIRKRRAEEMTKAGKENRRIFLQNMLGKEFPVLFEREKADGIHRGYAPNYAPVKLLTKYSEKKPFKTLRKSIFYVKIDKTDDDCCYGHIAENQPQSR